MLRENETRELLTKIDKIQKSYEDQIANVLVTAIRNSKEKPHQLQDIWNDAEKDITDLIYKMLEAIYSLILSFVKEVYPEASAEKLDIKDLTWQEDGKTIEERVKALCDFAYQALLDNVDISLRDNLIYVAMRIMNTESITVFNKILKKRVSKIYNIAQVINLGACEDVCDHWGDGFIPVAELAWPPYHPSCRCVVILFTADEIKNNE